MFGPSRRVARRTARRTSRRQMMMHDAMAPEPYDEPAYAAPAPQMAPEEPDYAAELEKLAQLKAKGIITEEEFEAKKKQVLGL